MLIELQDVMCKLAWFTNKLVLPQVVVLLVFSWKINYIS